MTSATDLRPATACANAALERLCAALDAAFEAALPARRGDGAEPSHHPAFVTGVRAALAAAAAEPVLLAPAQREGAPEGYRRHLLAADPAGRYAIAALVWLPGQASPVHAHHTWCGYAVLDGLLTESVYDWHAQTHCATEARVQPRAAGAVSFTRAGPGGIHQIRNTGTAPAISLHIYGVRGEQLSTHVNDLVRVAEPALSASLALQ